MSQIDLGPDDYHVEELAPQGIRRESFFSRLDFSFERLNLVKIFLISFVSLFFIEFLLGGTDQPGVLIALGANFAPFVERGEIWRLVTANFLHAGLAHLLVNGYSFWILGRFVEKVYGRSRLGIAFVLTACLASLGSWQLSGALSVGASGGITGLLGLLTAFTLYHRERLNPNFRQSFLSNLMLIVGINLFIGLTAKGIDHWAHLSGFVAGFGLGFILRPVVLFKERVVTTPIRWLSLLTGLVVALAFLIQTFVLVFGYLIPEAGPSRAWREPAGRYGFSYPAFFLDPGEGLKKGQAIIGNEYNRAIEYQVIDSRVAQAMLESLSTPGARISEGLLGGARIFEINLKSSRSWVRLVLLEAPSQALLDGQWLSFRAVSASRSSDEAHGRLLKRILGSLRFYPVEGPI